jgi:hypothetical protein
MENLKGVIRRKVFTKDISSNSEAKYITATDGKHYGPAAVMAVVSGTEVSFSLLCHSKARKHTSYPYTSQALGWHHGPAFSSL